MARIEDRVLILNSVDGVDSSRSHDFTIKFNPSLELGDGRVGNVFVGMDKVSMSYSWYNISSAYNNNTLKYSHDGGKTWTKITLSDGNYSYREMESIIKANLEINGHSETGVEIIYTPALFKVLVSLESGYQLDLREGELSELIGFDKRLITTTSYSDRLPDITRGVDTILVHCSLTSDSIVSGLPTDVIYDFSMENLKLSFPFSVEPKRVSLNRVNTSKISEVRVYITDAFLRPVILNGIPMSIKLIIRHVYD